MIPLSEAIDGALAMSSGTVRFAVFDFDNSCIVNDIQEATLAYVCRHGLLRHTMPADGWSDVGDSQEYHANVFRTYYDMLEKGDIDGAYRYCVRILTGFTVDEVRKLVVEVIKEEGDVAGKKIVFGIEVANGFTVRPQVMALMDECTTKGIKVYVITASSEPVVKAALTHYGIAATCIGVKLEEKDGVFQDSLVEPISAGSGKVENIKKYIDPVVRPVLGVGDSMNDLPMLEYSDVKVVVNRGNELARETEKKGWYLV